MIKSNIIKHTNHLQAEIRENIGLIAFNRPESKNSLSDELTPALRTTLENFESNKTEIGWGHQIRSYVLQPYRLVKDNRTNYESTDPDKILNGEIDSFLESSLFR